MFETNRSNGMASSNTHTHAMHKGISLRSRYRKAASDADRRRLNMASGISEATGVASHGFFVIRCFLFGRQILAAAALPEFEGQNVQILLKARLEILVWRLVDDGLL